MIQRSELDLIDFGVAGGPRSCRAYGSDGLIGLGDGRIIARLQSCQPLIGSSLIDVFEDGARSCVQL